jgi:hypothetical protein
MPVRLIILYLALATCPAAVGAAEAYRVVEDGESRSVRYLPHEPSGQALILVHGFSRSPDRMVGHAAALAEQGVTVVAPDLYSLMGGSKSRQKNVAFLLGLLRELAHQPLEVMLAGHSAGGALVFMTAVKAQEEDLPVIALVLLDAVPWDETVEMASRLRPLPLLSLTSEASSMNAWLKIEQLHSAIEFPFCHLYLVGSSHVDPEDPPGLFSRALTTENGRTRYAQLLKRYVLGGDFNGYVKGEVATGAIAARGNCEPGVLQAGNLKKDRAPYYWVKKSSTSPSLEDRVR